MEGEREKEKATRMTPELSAAAAFFIALKDEETRRFLKTHFSSPEVKPEVFSRRWITRDASRLLWQVAIFEKIFSIGRKDRFFTIAHVSVDATSGEVCGRWHLASVHLTEYLDFIRRSGAPHASCRDRSQ